jgi:uncharacterized membrane protein
MRLNMTDEPIRLPAWAASLLAVGVLPFVVSVLTGLDWRPALAAAVAAVIPLLAGAETLRAFTDSPATRARRLEHPARWADESGQVTLYTLLVVVLVVMVVLILAGRL